MRRQATPPSGREIRFGEHEIIVTKTDLKGHLTYANDVMQRVSGYTEAQLLGQPHNMIRHPDMPSAIFQLLWSTIQDGREIFAYVVNQASNGDAYWVFAHVTPSFGPDGRIVGYHSNRRLPWPDALEKVKPLYAQMVAEERRHSNVHEGMAASGRILQAALQRAGVGYDEFVMSLSAYTRLDRRVA